MYTPIFNAKMRQRVINVINYFNMKKERQEFENQLTVWMKVWEVLNYHGYELDITKDEDGEPAFDLRKVSK